MQISQRKLWACICYTRNSLLKTVILLGMVGGFPVLFYFSLIQFLYSATE